VYKRQDLTISIDRIGRDRYRVWLNDKQNNLRCNYIDINHYSSDSPSISLYFPITKSGAIDTVYVRDNDHEVAHYESKDFVFVISTFENQPYSSIKDYGRWTDSTMFKVPCVGVSLRASLNRIMVFDGPAISAKE